MAYRRYKKTLLNKDFTVHDGVKCKAATEVHTLLYIAWGTLGTVMGGSFIAGVLSGIFSVEDGLNNIPIFSSSFGAALYLSYKCCNNHYKKWQSLIHEYKKMQHQRCLELGLPLFIRNARVMVGSRSSKVIYYSAFLMPTLFEEEFLRFRKSDTCRQLVFDYEMDIKWVKANLRQCVIEEIKKSEVDRYLYNGMKPYILIDPNA